VAGLECRSHRLDSGVVVLGSSELLAAREHRAVLAACRQKDKQKAARQLKTHIVSAGESLLRRLERQRAANRRVAEA
jgi:DNA-binding GntR family transcriptional regulator